MNPLDEILTLGEASEKYGIPVDTLKKACTGQRGTPPRFTSEESRKSGKFWLVTKAGMNRLYRKEK